MKKLVSLITLVIVLQFTNANAQQNFVVNGVQIPRTLEFKGQTLALNGVGERSKFFTDLYVQALYLTKYSSDAKQI